MDEKFDKWDKRFIDMAQLVSTWSSCFQTNRQVGAVIVKNKRVMTTGYNGAASGIKSCKREELFAKRTQYTERNQTRNMLRYSCRAKCNYSGSKTRSMYRRSNALLYSPALRYMRKNDYKLGHKTHSIQRRISR